MDLEFEINNRIQNIYLNETFSNLKIKKVMKKNPISVDKNMLAAEALSIMNSKKITSLCVHQNNKKNKGTITLFYHDSEQLNKIIDLIKSNY